MAAPARGARPSSRPRAPAGEPESHPAAAEPRAAHPMPCLRPLRPVRCPVDQEGLSADETTRPRDQRTVAAPGIPAREDTRGEGNVGGGHEERPSPARRPLSGEQAIPTSYRDDDGDGSEEPVPRARARARDARTHRAAAQPRRRHRPAPTRLVRSSTNRARRPTPRRDDPEPRVRRDRECGRGSARPRQKDGTDRCREERGGDVTASNENDEEEAAGECRPPRRRMRGFRNATTMCVELLRRRRTRAGRSARARPAGARPDRGDWRRQRAAACEPTAARSKRYAGFPPP
jgi:hypothetical protein